MKIEINFVGLFNFDNKGSYKQSFSSLVNYIFGDNRVGKTLISKIPAYALGANIKLEKLEDDYKNFLTILSMNIEGRNYYFIRINSKKFLNDLYIFDSNFNEVFKGKTNAKKTPNTHLYNKEIYKLFNIENILCKKTKDKNISFETPYIGNFLEFFYIFESGWGKDWKSFAKDGINIKKEDFIYTFLYLTKEISDVDAYNMLNNEVLTLDIKKTNEEIKNINYLLTSLTNLTFSNNDIVELKNLDEKNNEILNKINKNEINLMVEINKKKNINSKKSKLNLILGQLENNIENINKFNKENEHFFQEVTIKDNYRKKIYLKDIVDFKIKFSKNINNLEQIKLELDSKEQELKNVNIKIKEMETENENLYNNLIKMDNKYFDISKKDINNNIRQIIANYKIKEEEVKVSLNDLNKKNKEYNYKVKTLDNSLKEFDQKYKIQLDNIIRDLPLKYEVKYENFINNTESTGAEAVIYSLSKLYINFLCINKIKSFYIIDSLKANDQDKKTIEAREIMIKKIIKENKNLRKQLIIFSSNKETLNIDETDETITQLKINREEPQSLLKFPDKDFNLWLENNILKRLS